jgi:hypothetical protein
MRNNKVLVAVIGVVLLLALCAGTSFLVVNSMNNHNLAVQRAAAAASHGRAVARASAAANAKAIAAANSRAAKAEAAAKAARASASKSAPAPVTVTPSAPQAPGGGAPQQPLANAAAVVTQYYQDLSNGDYADAWTLGGVNIAGTDYNTWVAGYATTTSVTLDAESQWNSTTVSASITATQSDGGSTSYQGTYTVNGGVIISASITQTG